VQWDNVLRAVAGDRAYRWLNAGRMEARGIAEFLMLDGRFPRSLAFCYAQLRNYLDRLADEYGDRLDTHDIVARTYDWLKSETIESVFETGLHQVIGQFIAANNTLAQQIQRDYRFTE